MQSPKVSVIMAAWNAEKTISESIASVQAQTFPDWELIVADDGSTDGTATLVEGIAQSDSRVRMLRLEHGGAAKARNAAVRTAKGEYIAVLDSDDVSMPDRLALECRFLDEHPDVSVVGGRSLRAGMILKPPCSNGTLQYMMTHCNPFHHSTVMFRKSAFGAGYREDYVAAHDYELLVRLGAVSRCVNIPHVLSERRVQPDSLSELTRPVQHANAKKISEAAMKRWLLDADGAKIAELAEMNIDGGMPTLGHKEYRRLHMKIAKAVMMAYPADAFEIFRWALAHLVEKKDVFFGNGIADRMMEVGVFVCYRLCWPGALAKSLKRIGGAR